MVSGCLNGSGRRLLKLCMVIGFTVIGTKAMAIEGPSFIVCLHEGAIDIRDHQAAVAGGRQRPGRYGPGRHGPGRHGPGRYGIV